MGHQAPSPLQPEQLHLYLLYLLDFPPRFPLLKGFRSSEEFENTPLAQVCPVRSLAQRRRSVIVCFLPFVCLPVLRAQRGGRVWARGDRHLS